MPDTAFASVASHLHAVKSHYKSEWHITCPECGHESSDKDPHCQMNESKMQWGCFSCGQGGSIYTLAKKMEIDIREGKALPVYQVKAKDLTPPSWTANPGPILERYQSHPDKVALWQAYKWVSQETIERLGWGVGVLPKSKCPHDRLIVPIFDGTMLVGLRGRAIDCDCGKWLAPAETKPELYPMYGEYNLTPGCTAWIVENPVDAQKLFDETGMVGLAIYSCSYWFDRWTDALVRAKPQLVVNALDNDLVGNGGALRRKEFIERFIKEHPKSNGRFPSIPAAVKITKALAGLSFPVRTYDWKRAEYKTDIGSLLK